MKALVALEDGTIFEGFERQLDAIRGLIAEDPGRVAIVFQEWIMTND